MRSYYASLFPPVQKVNLLRKLRKKSFKGMANQPLEKFLEIKGLGDVKISRIAATFEIARRIVNQVLKEYNKG